ncbi:MAG: hypothetical protein IJN30_00090 [Bacteroidales bacterium]|nr:hypothetical protein [Bacteroidales bacterium]MBQ7019380.1 hypothetical protein [Bacteroidales bacterium]
MKQKELILKRFDNLNFLKASHEIVKYSPEYYDENGVYQRNEWTAFSDIGKEYEGKVVTKEDYLDVENRFIDITQSILKAAGCTYITLGYIYSRRKNLKEGKRVRISDIAPYIRLALRGKAYIVFINSKRNIQFDFSEDYLYMHLYCRISDSQLNSIVESRGLYLDPRVKRVIMFDDDNDELNIHYFDKNA